MADVKRGRGRPIRGELPLDNPITVRLDAAAKQALEDLSGFYGLSKGAAVQKAITEAWKALTPAQRRALAALKKAREEA